MDDPAATAHDDALFDRDQDAVRLREVEVLLAEIENELDDRPSTTGSPDPRRDA